MHSTGRKSNRELAPANQANDPQPNEPRDGGSAKDIWETVGSRREKLSSDDSACLTGREIGVGPVEPPRDESWLGRTAVY